MEIFKVQDLTYYYPRKEKPSICDINITINEGEFILLLGESGSGKSTFGRIFNNIVPNFYGGKIKGNINGTVEAGMVFQDPEKQLVMDKVERELAFGLENIGVDNETMKKRVMETLSFINIHDIKDEKTYQLSGGQKQKVAIASILSMGYKFLVLDEITSQLDPISADEIMHIVKRLNEDLGYTILLIEQRMDRCFHLADRILFMENGKLIFDGQPNEFVFWAKERDKKFLPPVVDYFANFEIKNVPFNVKEGRKKLNKVVDTKTVNNIHVENNTNKEVVVSAKNVHYIYPNENEALKGINLEIFSGEVLAILGENGGGKSTLLKNICSLLKPTKGNLKVNKEVGYLSQNPNDYLFNDTVYEELKYTLDNKNVKNYEIIETVLNQLDIYKYKDINPRDLSGGERQRVALASILVLNPDILILDEPTRGLDNELKNKIGNIIVDFKNKGKTVILVTHDVEFASKFCDRTCLIFDGSVVQIGSKYKVLTSGIYYSTQINKLFSGINESVLTIEDALSLSGEAYGL